MPYSLSGIYGSSACVYSEAGISLPSRTDKTLRFGIEMEYNRCEGYHRNIYSVFRELGITALLKYDCSLNSGVEINTLALPPGEHLKQWKTFWEKSYTQNRMSSTSGTGMHIHFPQHALSRLTVGKLTQFINMRTNREFVKLCAGRTSDYWCRYDHNHRVKQGAKKRVSGRGAICLNTRNQITAEVRIFQSPANYDEFAQRVGFLFAAIKFAEETSMRRLSYFYFLHWLAANHKRWKEVDKFYKFIKTTDYWKRCQVVPIIDVKPRKNSVPELAEI